jgi:hypothetical protein
VANPNKAKGDRAEREAAHLLSEMLDRDIRRKLGAGRQDDTGDLDGLDNWTLQVKNRRDIARTIREGMPQLEQQRQNAKTDHAAMLCRQPGGTWIVVMTLEQLTKLIN